MKDAFPEGHYHSPIPDASELEHDAERIWPKMVPGGIAGIDLHPDIQVTNFKKMELYSVDAPWQDDRQEGLRYSYKDGGWNVWYTKVDALDTYAMLRVLRPRRLIEVGSGYSSALILDTNDRFLNRQMNCCFIDQDTYRVRVLLFDRDLREQTVLPERVQDVALETFDELQQGDILFIDSSHVVKTGSDVNHLFFQVLPRLKAGVYIHFHDIFDCFEYPREWLEKGIHFSEAYMLRAFLMHNHDYEVIFWGAFMGRGSSIWLQKVNG